MKRIEFDRDRQLRAALQPGPACPPLAELLDTLFSGAATPAAETLRSHAAACPACAAELALAGAWDAAPRSASEAEEIAWIATHLEPPVPARQLQSPESAPPLARVLPMAAAVAARAKRARRTEGRGEMSLWRRWAAAALLVVGLGLTFEWGHRNFAPALPDRADAVRSDVVRSGEILLDAPVGAQGGRLPAFAWRAVAGAASYRLEVRDVAGDLLWQSTALGAGLAVPAELEAKLESFVTYRWNVTALDAGGAAIAQSAVAAFRLEPAN